MAGRGWTVRQIPAQDGKTVVITGANSGIGLQAAVELARAGARVLLGCRNYAKGEAALDRLRREVPGAKAELWELDMAALASVRAFAAAFAEGGTALDVLVNNAGVMALPRREVTADGFERQFGTNHLGHFALTGLLMPQLLRAPAPRVVTVASLAHRNGTIDFENLQSERRYRPWDAYGASKLANLLFARELDRRARAERSRLVSVPVHPGVSQTNIVANGPGASDLRTRVLFLLGKFLTSKDAEGAWPTLYAATSPEVRGGEYIGPGGFLEFKGPPRVVQPRARALDEAVGKRLWAASEELTGVHYPPLG